MNDDATLIVGTVLSPDCSRLESLNSKRVSFTVFALMIIVSVKRNSCSRLDVLYAREGNDVSPTPWFLAVVPRKPVTCDERVLCVDRIIYSRAEREPVGRDPNVAGGCQRY